MLTDGRHRGYLAGTKSVIVLNIVVIMLPGVADHEQFSLHSALLDHTWQVEQLTPYNLMIWSCAVT